MVEELDLEELGRLAQPSRQAVIGLAGGGIARGMIVHDDDGVGGINQGGAKDIARMSDAFIDAA